MNDKYAKQIAEELHRMNKILSEMGDKILIDFNRLREMGNKANEEFEKSVSHESEDTK